MNEIQVFNYGEVPVRTTIKDGEPWWVLKDVCQILGINNHRDLPKRLDTDEVGRFELPHPQNPTNVRPRPLSLKGSRKGGGSSSRKYVCPCCGAIIRATKEVHVICAECDVEFQEEI